MFALKTIFDGGIFTNEIMKGENTPFASIRKQLQSSLRFPLEH